LDGYYFQLKQAAARRLLNYKYL